MSYLNKVKKQKAAQERWDTHRRDFDRARRDRGATRTIEKEKDKPYPFTKLKAMSEKAGKPVGEVLSCSNCLRPIEREKNESMGYFGGLFQALVSPKPHRPSTCPGPQETKDAGNPPVTKAQ